MDLKHNLGSPVIAEPLPVSKLGLRSNLMAATAGYSSSGLYPNVPKRRLTHSKLDEVRVSGWLDAMRSSSPPRKKPSKDLGHDETDQAYYTWLMKYPSALTWFEQIVLRAKGKEVALFLDYDGTLSPIVNNPDNAIMSNAMRATVKVAATYFSTAIISGRARDKVFEFVKLPELFYAGSHGMDIMGPARKVESIVDHPNCVRSTDKQGKEVNLFQPASEFLPMIDEVFSSLVESTGGITGAKVENNRFCVSVHYRNVNKKHWDLVAQIVNHILKSYPCLRLTHGRKVLEVRPVIDWDKGKAVEFLLESLGLSNCDDVLPIYIGDDRTDEDAFKVLRKGNSGCGILVSSVPRETDAFYSLRDPSEVMKFLKLLVKWKKDTSS